VGKKKGCREGKGINPRDRRPFKRPHNWGVTSKFKACFSEDLASKKIWPIETRSSPPDSKANKNRRPFAVSRSASHYGVKKKVREPYKPGQARHGFNNLLRGFLRDSHVPHNARKRMIRSPKGPGARGKMRGLKLVHSINLKWGNPSHPMGKKMKKNSEAMSKEHPLDHPRIIQRTRCGID